MTETIRFRFTPEGKDYSRVMRAHSLRTRAVWLSLAAMIAILVVFLWTSTYRLQGCLLLWLIVVVAPLFAAFAVFVWQPYRVRRQVEREEQLRSEMIWEVDDTQVVITTSLAAAKMDWQVFRQVLETKTDFLLCMAASKHMVRFVPKRAFDSPEQEEAFRALVRSKLRSGRWV